MGCGTSAQLQVAPNNHSDVSTSVQQTEPVAPVQDTKPLDPEPLEAESEESSSIKPLEHISEDHERPPTHLNQPKHIDPQQGLRIGLEPLEARRSRGSNRRSDMLSPLETTSSSIQPLITPPGVDMRASSQVFPRVQEMVPDPIKMIHDLQYIPQNDDTISHEGPWKLIPNENHVVHDWKELRDKSDKTNFLRFGLLFEITFHDGSRHIGKLMNQPEMILYRGKRFYHPIRKHKYLNFRMDDGYQVSICFQSKREPLGALAKEIPDRYIPTYIPSSVAVAAASSSSSTKSGETKELSMTASNSRAVATNNNSDAKGTPSRRQRKLSSSAHLMPPTKIKSYFQTEDRPFSRKCKGLIVSFFGNRSVYGTITNRTADAFVFAENSSVNYGHPLCAAAEGVEKREENKHFWADHVTLATATPAMSEDIYIIGGQVTGGVRKGKCSGQVIHFDLRKGVTTPCSVLPTPRLGHMSFYYGGRIFVFGGMLDQVRFEKSLACYDIKADSWSTLSGEFALKGGASCMIDGKIYFAGGIAEAEIDRLPTPQEMAQFPSGHVLKLFDETKFRAQACVYDPATHTFTDLPDMPEKRCFCSGASMDGKFYVVGGQDDKGPHMDAVVYDPVTNEWGRVPGKLQINHLSVGQNAVFAVEGRIVVVSGYRCQYFDIQKQRWNVDGLVCGASMNTGAASCLCVQPLNALDVEVVDENNDGIIDEEELAKALKNHSGMEAMANYSGELLQNLDTNNDGEVDLEEFKQYQILMNAEGPLISTNDGSYYAKVDRSLDGEEQESRYSAIQYERVCGGTTDFVSSSVLTGFAKLRKFWKWGVKKSSE